VRNTRSFAMEQPAFFASAILGTIGVALAFYGLCFKRKSKDSIKFQFAREQKPGDVPEKYIRAREEFLKSHPENRTN